MTTPEKMKRDIEKEGKERERGTGTDRGRQIRGRQTDRHRVLL